MPRRKQLTFDFRLLTSDFMTPSSRFIGEPIIVEFDQPPLLEKKPRCPDRIVWAGETLAVVEKLSEWQDYQRRGRMAQNMQPAHAAVAQQRGSWGVGRFYFRVRVAGDRLFDIYYDRAPQDADRRKGSWHIYREVSE
jgi:hypothetical protein